MDEYAGRLSAARAALSGADAILLGAGAGLSAAAGLTYGGQRFADLFSDFIAKYRLTDMYTASFYPFPTPEEAWAYFSRHIEVNRFAPPALPLYLDLLSLVKGKPYFVLTTNVDGQFAKAGFPPERVFATQGDYAYLQCAKACHDTLYDDEPLVKQMLAAEEDCRIPAALVPRCPVCGGPMAVHLRKDAYFVQDAAWYAANDRYAAFLEETAGTRLVLLELGVGYNTPGVIRYPFERMAYLNPRATLLRLNRDDPGGAAETAARTIAFPEDMRQVVAALLGSPGETEREG